MEATKLYTVQVKEALAFYKNEHIEYKRLSHILLDNIIEVLLKIKIKNQIYRHYRNKISETEIDKKLKSCEYFDNLIKESKNTGIITEEERKVLNFTHDVRNVQFHEPYTTEFSHINCQKKLVECGILCNIEFLVSASSKFVYLNSDLTKTHEYFREPLSKKVGLNKPVELILLLSEAYSKRKTSPNILLSTIIAENITMIEEFFENDAMEDWESFRNKALDEYSSYLKSQEQQLSEKELKNFPFMSDAKLERIKLLPEKFLKLDTYKSIESYCTFQSEYGNLLKGITLYQLSNSYYDNDD
jgi:hypothetical protein